MPPREPQRAVFQPPTCLTEARVARQKLIEEIAGISTQLSDKNKRRRCEACEGKGCTSCGNEGSVRWPDHEYHEWRQRALTALRARESVLRRINAWIRQEDARLEIEASGAPPEPHALIQRAHNLFLTLAEDGVDFDPEEWAVVEALRAYLEPKTQAA